MLQFDRAFFDVLNKARSTGNKDICINTVRKLNNCPFALKLKGDIKIQEIFDDNWEDFLQKHNKNNLRTAITTNVEKILKFKKLELGMSYYECENCGNFHITFHTCKSSFCPTCGKKRRDQIAANVSRKIINVPHRQLVFTLPKELRGYFRLYRDQLSILLKPLMNL